MTRKEKFMLGYLCSIMHLICYFWDLITGFSFKNVALIGNRSPVLPAKYVPLFSTIARKQTISVYSNNFNRIYNENGWWKNLSTFLTSSFSGVKDPHALCTTIVMLMHHEEFLAILVDYSPLWLLVSEKFIQIWFVVAIDSGFEKCASGGSWFARERNCWSKWKYGSVGAQSTYEWRQRFVLFEATCRMLDFVLNTAEMAW